MPLKVGRFLGGVGWGERGGLKRFDSAQRNSGKRVNLGIQLWGDISSGTGSVPLVGTLPRRACLQAKDWGRAGQSLERFGQQGGCSQGQPCRNSLDLPCGQGDIW